MLMGGIRLSVPGARGGQMAGHWGHVGPNKRPLCVAAGQPEVRQRSPVGVGSGGSAVKDALLCIKVKLLDGSVLQLNKKPSCCWDGRLVAPNQSTWRSRPSKVSDGKHDFHLSGLELTQWRSSNVKFVYDLEVSRKGQTRSKLIADSEPLVSSSHLVFHRSHMPISHHQKGIGLGDFHIRDLQITPKKVNQGQRSWCTFTSRQCWTFLSRCTQA